MMQDRWNAVWERVRSGRHTVVIGSGPLSTAPNDLKVIRVSCEAPGASGGVLEAARRQIMQLIGEEVTHSEPAPGQLEAGLRRRLLGDLPGPPLEAKFVEACNRLADRTDRRTVLVLESIDAADPVTVEGLTQLLRSPGWLRLPLLLTVRSTPQGQVAALINRMRQDDSEAVVLMRDHAAPTSQAAPPFAWTRLPPHVLRVLRAGSVCGTTFEADVVARLLDEPLGVVLEQLQGAVDAGAPLTDRGDGWFSLPSEAIDTLQGGITPSLLTFWHARLGELLAGGRPGERLAGIEPSTQGVGRDEVIPTTTRQMPAPPEAPSATPPSASKDEPRTTQPLGNYAALFDSGQRIDTSSNIGPGTATQAPTQEISTPPAQPPWMAERVAPITRQSTDQARAATHLRAAGRTEAAVEQYLAAVREAAARGDARRAYGLAVQALQVLDDLPSSPRRALLRAQLLLEMGSLQWHGALLGAPFTLQGALESLEAARSTVPDESPPEVIARLAATTAGVCYDMGDLDSLQHALAELTAVSRRLLSGGESLLAASLLNDQAAVYVRLGDPVRAAHLLEESRKLFEGRLRSHPDEALAIEEFAETLHLLARLPLHAPIRPGREADAYAMSLEHARAAEGAYRRLGQRRELARVWETMGRIELQQGHHATAEERLSAALELQRQIGDVTGLARSTAALAELCGMTGRLDAAVALLADSITLNFEKGSPLGLAVNRQAFDALAAAVAQIQGPKAEQLRAVVAQVEDKLVRAESVLGRVVLPGEERAG